MANHGAFQFPILRQLVIGITSQFFNVHPAKHFFSLT
jgi:hypothetical protein